MELVKVEKMVKLLAGNSIIKFIIFTDLIDVYKFTFLLFALCILSCKTNEIHLQNNIHDSKMISLNHEIDSLNNIIYQIKSNLLITKAKPGKVISRCAYQPQFEKVNYKYIIYTGKDTNLPFLEKVDIIIKPYYKQWKKIRINDICEAYKEEKKIDCEIWQLKEYNAEIETVYQVIDTTKTKEFEIKTFNVSELIKESKLSGWYEVSCPLVAQKNLYKKVQSALIKNGYKLTEVIDNIIDKDTKKALIDYQKKNNLPVGQLDIETLKSLGIK